MAHAEPVVEVNYAMQGHTVIIVIRLIADVQEMMEVVCHRKNAA